MKTTRPIFGILGIAAALLPICGAITARGTGTELYLSYGVGEEWNVGGSSSFTGSLSVPQFNPALGVLNSVDVDFTGFYQSGITVSANTGGSYSVTAIASLSLQGNGINLTTTGGWGPLEVGPLPNFPLAAATANIAGTDQTYGALNGLIGDGSASFQVPLSQIFNINNNPTPPTGVTYAVNSSDFDATLTLTYGYTPVPEPSSFCLLGMGLGLITVARKALRKGCSAVGCD